MDKKVYIIQGSKGTCPSDAYDWLECAYLDINVAIRNLFELNRILEELKKTRPEYKDYGEYVIVECKLK